MKFKAPPQSLQASLLDYYKSGQLPAAEQLAIKFTEEYPMHHFGWKVLGAIFCRMGRLEEALDASLQSVELEPQDPEAHCNLGNIYQASKRIKDAVKSYQNAIRIRPDFAEAYSNLGVMLEEMGLSDDSEKVIRKAINLAPTFAPAYYNLGNTLKSLGRFRDAEDCYIRAIELQPEYFEAHNNLLMLSGSMCFQAERYLKYAKGFADAIGIQATNRFTTWRSTNNPARLRVGLVSGDFNSHPVGYFLEGLLARLQFSSIELYAYPTVNIIDGLTLRIKKFFSSWTLLFDKSDDEAAKIIYGDAIDILIDLSGHTVNNRLAIFARKPAPIQITWLGYYASTGLSEIDYILGDPFVTPLAEEHHFTEKIWQLPESYFCFTPPANDITVNQSPALVNNFITFGCFNKLNRMTEHVLLSRVKILQGTPGSKLFLKDRQLENQSRRDYYISLFEQYGIDSERLILEGMSNREEYLNCYNRVDIALSPFPYGGGTTTIEGLWMGVPAVCLKGYSFLSHIGETIAENTGLSDWIATDEEDYIVKSIKFASNPNALDNLRSSLRERLSKTPIFNADLFSQNFELALLGMHKKASSDGRI